jgi:trimethylamine---corrinoid protein Co-methyltransferase
MLAGALRVPSWRRGLTQRIVKRLKADAHHQESIMAQPASRTSRRNTSAAPFAANQEAYASVQFSGLSPQQCQRLHWASLEVLDSTGVRLFSQSAIDLAMRGGADVVEGNRVRFPAGMIEKAFTTAPRRLVLCDRAGRRVLPVEGHNCFYGPGSDTLNLIDHRTGLRRPPLLNDVVEGVTVCDALDHIDFVMSMVLPTDVDRGLADRYQMELMLRHTTKPIVFVSYDLQGCIDVVEMAEIVAGGPDALRRNPHVACYVNVTSGLHHNAEALDKLLYLAGKGIPTTYIPVVIGGASSPVTPAAEVVLVNVGALVGLVLSQLACEGAPYLLPGWSSSVMDMRTMVAHYCEPQKNSLIQALDHYYGLPIFSLAGASDSKLVDQQAGAEAALGILTNTLGGGNLIHDLGYLESGMSFSFAQLAICDDIVGWVQAFAGGCDVSSEALALHEIQQAGIDGQYLDHPHTLAHFRERYYPDLLDRNIYDGWMAAGSQSLLERACQKVDRILGTHEVEPLPPDVMNAVHAVVERAALRHLSPFPDSC